MVLINGVFVSINPHTNMSIETCQNIESLTFIPLYFKDHKNKFFFFLYNISYFRSSA